MLGELQRHPLLSPAADRDTFHSVNHTAPRRKLRLLTVIGPGILVAATGVGAGDLATAAFTGSQLGVAVLWAVVLGAALKFVLNEGLARWQLATGETLLEGAVGRFGRPVHYFFLAYLLFWSFFVASALMSACGVAAHAILPLVDSETDKIIYGLAHSAAAVLLVLLGGYRLFEKVMGVCIAIMFVTVVTTAIAVRPDWSQVASGLVVPAIPKLEAGGLQWTIALMGGVGGTVTVLCYGYWIREEGRGGTDDVRICRIDLATGYAMTAIFGIAMVILGDRVTVPEGRGATLIVQLADRLETALGAFGAPARWMFLIGAWGAMASSLLGVWQSVPYLFADLWRLRQPGGPPVDVRGQPYRLYLFALATLPAIGLWTDFRNLQKLYAIVGAAFIPMLALALLVLNGRSKWIGREYRNRWPTSLLLIAALVLSGWAAWYVVVQRLAV